MSRAAVMHSDASNGSPADVSVTVQAKSPRRASGRKSVQDSAASGCESSRETSRHSSPVRADPEGWARKSAPHFPLRDEENSDPRSSSGRVERRRPKVQRRPSAPMPMSPFALPAVQSQTVPPEPVKASQMVMKPRKHRSKATGEAPTQPDAAPVTVVPPPVGTKPRKAPAPPPAAKLAHTAAPASPVASPTATTDSSHRESSDSVFAPKPVVADKTAGAAHDLDSDHKRRGADTEHASCWPRWFGCFTGAH